MVSSALELMNDILNERGGGAWNIYGAQASDGDNWENDFAPLPGAARQAHPALRAVLRLHRDHPGEPPEPVAEYEKLRRHRRNFAMQHSKACRTSIRCS